jgi:sarcosine oxidase
MVSQEFELIVVGAGVAGLSTALAAAKSGVRSILCLDQYGVANSHGASGDGLRLFRLSYFEHPAYVPLLRQAIESWRELGDDLYVPVGGFYAGPLNSELVQGSMESGNMHRIPHDVMPSVVAKAKFPQFTLPPDYVVFFESEGGFVRAAKGTHAIAEAVQKRDVEIRQAEVLQITSVGNRWLVEGDGFEYTGTKVIVAAGNDTGSLIPLLRPHLTMETHLMLWLKEFDSLWENSPGFGIMNDGGEMLYGFPTVDEVPGVKIGGHHEFSSESLEGQENRLKQLAAKYLPSLSGEVLSRKSCHYDMSRDGNFIFGEVEPGLSVACGFSGHGFKFGPVLGELAWHAAIGDLPDELSFLSVKRLL